jgi:hypothetical protein
MQGVDEALLRPSLAAGAGARAPYSTQMGMQVSFFGGPFAALAVLFINATRLRRLRPEALPLALVAAATLALDAWMLLDVAPVLRMSQMLSTSPENALHLALRALSLAVFAAGLLLHRQRERAAALLGLDRPRGLWVGIGLIVGGVLVQGLVDVALDGVRE